MLFYPPGVSVEIVTATRDRLQVLSEMFGRAFVDEPTMRWPLGDHGDIADRFTRCYEYFLDGLIDLDMVWEASGGLGAAVWIPPGKLDAWERAVRGETRNDELTDDGGLRWRSFWDWVESKLPDEELWHLDSVGVAPEAQGQGIGSALIRFGLERAAAEGVGAHLETGTPRNVEVYEHLGFRTVEAVHAPGGGPLIWFMRWDPD
jgi:GNAT superfamily N-acetyltransferase